MIFYKRFLLLLVLLGLASSLKAQQFTTHGIIMLIDTSEYEEDDEPLAYKELGALSLALTKALGDKAAPIITTSALLNRIFKYKKGIFQGADITQGDFDAWIYKKINDLYYLLIPKDYVSGLEKQTAKTVLKGDKLTDLELKLGLKINHLETVTQKDAVTVSKVIVIESIVNKLNDIFVLNSEYATQKIAEKPRWATYLMGHGGFKKDLVAGLPIKEYQKILEFLDTKISMGFLYFNTCYSGGKKLEAIYQDVNKNAVQKTFNFTIASAATAEAPTGFFMTYQDRIIPIFYTSFFKALKQDGPIDFVETLNFVAGFAKEGKIFNFSNIPLLKLPGLEWVSVVDIPNKIVSLGKTLARSRDADQPLDVSTFFARGKVKKIYPEAILLYTDIIPFPLKLSQQTHDSLPPAWISMMGGNAVHEFAHIDAREFKAFDVFMSFLQIESLRPQKIFLIRELNVKNDDRIQTIKEGNQDLTLYNVILINNIYPQLPVQQRNAIYFTTASNVYYSDPFISSQRISSITNFEVREIKENYLDEWLKQAATIKTENQQQPQSLFAENLDELKKVMQQRVGKTAPAALKPAIKGKEIGMSK